MRRSTWIALLACALLALPAFAGEEQPNPKELAELAKGVKSYPTKFKLIKMGVRAVGPLMGQLDSKDTWLVFESRSALRWIVHHARRDKRDVESLAHHLAECVSSDVVHPEEQRAFAAGLLGDLGHPKGVEALARAASGEGIVRGAAVDALRRIPGQAATDRLLALAGKAKGEQRDAVVLALGARGDPAGFSMLSTLAYQGDKAAIRALGISGLVEAESTLKDLCEKEQPGAFDAWLQLARAQTKTRMLARAFARAANDEQRLQVIRAVADVPVPEGEMLAVLSKAMVDPSLRPAAQHALMTCVRMLDGAGPETVYAKVLAESVDEAITLRALAGLGRTGSADSVGLVAPFLIAKKRAMRTTALTALARLPGKEATAALITQLDKATDLDDASLLIRLVKERGSAEAMPALMRVMTASQGAVKTQAGEALIALADKGGVEEARKVHHQLLEAGVQMAALEGLVRTGDASSIDRIAPFKAAASADLTDRASAALVAIGDRLATTDKPSALKAYRAALDCGAMVENRLRLLGESIEITARGGRVSAWWVAGPFRAPDQASWTKAESPEQGVDLKATMAVGKRELPWKPVQVGGEDAIVDLDSLFSPNDNVAAYAFAEVHVKKARKGVFKTGSDDGIRVWVNGTLAFSKLVPRGITVDEDSFEAELKEGRNELLVKVCEGGGGWGFCLRIEDERGRPLKFKIR